MIKDDRANGERDCLIFDRSDHDAPVLVPENCRQRKPFVCMRAGEEGDALPHHEDDSSRPTGRFPIRNDRKSSRRLLPRSSAHIAIISLRCNFQSAVIIGRHAAWRVACSISAVIPLYHPLLFLHLSREPPAYLPSRACA